MSTPNNTVIVGKIGRPHGVQGWLSLVSFTNPIESILNYEPWWLSQHGQWVQVTAKETQHTKAGKLLVKFPECNDRTAASHYTNRKIAVERDQLPKTEPNEYYWADLEGLTVVNREEKELGIVDHLLETGAHDVLIVYPKPKGKPIAIPYRFGVTVIQVDLERQRIVVDWDQDY